MEEHELLRRAEDLAAQCRRRGALTHTTFLTPAERVLLERCFQGAGLRPLFSGGHPACERTAAFFLPDYWEPESFDPAEAIGAIRLTAHFGQPGHRDYLGALLGMGVGRERLGDVWVSGGTATVFCLRSVQSHLLGIERVGRVHVTAEAAALTELAAPERTVKELSFSVMSPRLDAVVAGLFRLPRAEAARQIALGAVSVNYQESHKPDTQLREGDILSLRGAGKGRLVGFGGSSRKGRLFIHAELFQ